MRTTLTVPEPFRLDATLRSHGWLWAAPFHPDLDAGRLVRIETVRGRPVRIDVREGRRADRKVALVVESDAPERDRPAVRATVTKMLGLDEDLTGFYALARREPRLRPLLRLGAGRTARAPSLFEDCIKGIVQTNILWKQALVCMARLNRLGTPHRDGALHAFPTPEQILDAGSGWLKDEARVGYRADAIVRLAEEVASGARDLADLERRAPRLTTAELVRELQDIRGIGPSTAQALAGLLRKHDVVSVDSSTIGYVAKHYPGAYGGERPTPKEAAAVFDRYGAWRGKAWWYEAWLAAHVAGNGDRPG